jgi:hypothetical protein
VDHGVHLLPLTNWIGCVGDDHGGLIAWSADDEFFPIEDANRLAAALPNSRVEVIPQAKTFSMIDQPDLLADLITDFADAGAPADPGNAS